MRASSAGSGLAAAMVASLLACGPAWASTVRTWHFDVFLDERRIGAHEFTITADAAGEIAQVAADFNVRVLFLDLYRYKHRNLERWQGPCLHAVDATTDDNGETSRVQARRSGDGLQVEAAQGSQVFEGCVMSFAYWNPRILQATHLFNPQTGELAAVEIEALGPQTIQVRGAPALAERYRLRGEKFAIDLWYSPQGDWLRLEADAAGERRLRYELR
ncbi:MAG: DUF6134 family protein [Gammaproteobacteria bacterium]